MINEQESHGNEQPREGRLHVAEQRVFEWHRRDGTAPQCIGMLTCQGRHHTRKVSLGSLQLRMILQSCTT